MKKLPPTQSSASNDHDALFTTSLSDPRIVKDFLQQHLPSNLLAAVDLATLEVCKDKFIDENLDTRFTDMLYRLKLKNSEQDAYVATLLEHRSTPQKYMPLRVLHYECSIMKQHLKLYGRVPLVFSLVYYNGKKRWHYPLDLKALIDAPTELIEQYALKPFQLVELNQISDEALRQHVWSGLLGIVMKHIYDRDILPVLEKILTWLKAAEQQNGHEFVRSLLYYIYKKGDIPNATEFQALISTQLSEDIGKEIMTLAQLHTEQGERKMLVRLLERRFGPLSPKDLTRLNAAHDEQLLDWSERVFDARTLKDIFEA